MIRFEMSIDKIEVIFYCKKIKLPDIDGDFRYSYLENLLDEYEMRESYISSNIQTFKYNYFFRKYGENEGGFYLGIWDNNPKAVGEQERLLRLEWNPNKTEIPAVVREFLEYEKMVFTEVKECDIAFDFADIHPYDIRYFTRCDTNIYNSLTHYIRKGHQHLSIKIYDKTKERREKMKEFERQITRIEITLKKPKFAYGRDENVFYKDGWEYLQGLTRALAEICIPTDFHTRMDDLREKYGEYDSAMLYALRCLTPDQLYNALSLMSKQTATKYRAALKRGDVESFNLDEMTLAREITKMIQAQIVALEPPAREDDWLMWKYRKTDYDGLTEEERVQKWASDYQRYQRQRKQRKQNDGNRTIK